MPRAFLLLAMAVALLPGSAWASLLAEFTQQVVSDRETVVAGRADDDLESLRRWYLGELQLPEPMPSGRFSGVVVSTFLLESGARDLLLARDLAGVSWNFQMLVVSSSDEFVEGLRTIGDLVNPLAEYSYPYRGFEVGDKVMGGTHPAITPDYDGDGEIWNRYGSIFERRRFLTENLFAGGLEITNGEPSALLQSFPGVEGTVSVAGRGLYLSGGAGVTLYTDPPRSRSAVRSGQLPAGSSTLIASSSGTGQGASIAPIPEPGTGVLVASCLAGFAWLRRRRAIR